VSKVTTSKEHFVTNGLPMKYTLILKDILQQYNKNKERLYYGLKQVSIEDYN